MRNPRRTFKKFIKYAIVAIIAFFVLSYIAFIVKNGCQSDTIRVDADNKKSPQYRYRKDEVALLALATDTVMEMEQQKKYAEIYQQYGSNEFKRLVSRRTFLKMSHCVETHLGEITEFDRSDLGFNRNINNGQKLDKITRRVHRSSATVEEQLILVFEGLDVKLNGIFWISDHKNFIQCMQDITKQPKGAVQKKAKSGEEETPTAGAGQAESTGDGASAGSEPPHAPNTEEQPVDSGNPSTGATESETASPEPSPRSQSTDSPSQTDQAE